jgi:glycosyltransferase involved in cell wall biosynthesis
MIKMKNVLFVGPVPPPIHGQSIAFYGAFKSIQHHNKYLVNQNVTGKSFVKTIALILLAILKIILYLSVKKIDIVYFTCSRSKEGSLLDIILIYLSKLFNAKLINHLHGADFKDFYEFLNGIFRKVIRNSYMKVDVSIVLLDEMKQQFSSYFPKMRLEVVPNFYENILDQIQIKKISKEIRILYLSNIMKSKGILDLLDAFQLLTQRYNNLSLTIAGDFIGDYLMNKSDIKKVFFNKLEQLNHIAEGKIRYVGIVHGKEKIQLFENSDIFVFPTYHKAEAFPLTLIEALRAGNVIITTRHNFLPEIVSEDNGCLVDVKSPRMIEDAVARFVEDKERMRQIQRYNINYARERYSQELYIKRIVNILENV